MEITVLVAALSVIIGFVAGALLSATLTSEAKVVESRLRLAIAVARQELVVKRDQLEKDTKESFALFNADVENIVKRLEAIEGHLEQKICDTINPAGKA